MYKGYLLLYPLFFFTERPIEKSRCKSENWVLFFHKAKALFWGTKLEHACCVAFRTPPTWLTIPKFEEVQVFLPLNEHWRVQVFCFKRFDLFTWIGLACLALFFLSLVYKNACKRSENLKKKMQETKRKNNNKLISYNLDSGRK